MKDGAMRLEVRGEKGFVATGSVVSSPSATDGQALGPLLDAAEVKAKAALRTAIPDSFLSSNTPSLQGVKVLTRCVYAGRAYARVWVSEVSLNTARSQSRVIADSLSTNPTPKPQSESSTMLEEDAETFSSALPTKRLDSLGL
jgi:hypothetical protein